MEKGRGEGVMSILVAAFSPSFSSHPTGMSEIQIVGDGRDWFDPRERCTHHADITPRVTRKVALPCSRTAGRPEEERLVLLSR